MDDTIRNSFLNQKYQFTKYWNVDSVDTIRNAELEGEYAAKKIDFFREGRKKYELNERLLMGCYAKEEDAVFISQNGLHCGSDETVSYLGNGSKGVTVGKHADIFLQSFYNNGYEQCWIIVFKVVTGRQKDIRPFQTPPFPEPTVGADSHMSLLVPNPDDDLRTREMKSQVYLYEKGQYGEFLVRPRQCLPIACVKFRRVDPLQNHVNNSCKSKESDEDGAKRLENTEERSEQNTSRTKDGITRMGACKIKSNKMGENERTSNLLTKRVVNSQKSVDKPKSILNSQSNASTKQNDKTIITKSSTSRGPDGRFLVKSSTNVKQNQRMEGFNSEPIAEQYKPNQSNMKSSGSRRSESMSANELDGGGLLEPNRACSQLGSSPKTVGSRGKLTTVASQIPASIPVHLESVSSNGLQNNVFVGIRTQTFSSSKDRASLTSHASSKIKRDNLAYGRPIKVKDRSSLSAKNISILSSCARKSSITHVQNTIPQLSQIIIPSSLQSRSSSDTRTLSVNIPNQLTPRMKIIHPAKASSLSVAPTTSHAPILTSRPAFTNATTNVTINPSLSQTSLVCRPRIVPDCNKPIQVQHVANERLQRTPMCLSSRVRLCSTSRIEGNLTCENEINMTSNSHTGKQIDSMKEDSNTSRSNGADTNSQDPSNGNNPLKLLLLQNMFISSITKQLVSDLNEVANILRASKPAQTSPADDLALASLLKINDTFSELTPICVRYKQLINALRQGEATLHSTCDSSYLVKEQELVLNRCCKVLGDVFSDLKTSLSKCLAISQKRRLSMTWLSNHKESLIYCLRDIRGVLEGVLSMSEGLKSAANLLNGIATETTLSYNGELLKTYESCQRVSSVATKCQALDKPSSEQCQPVTNAIEQHQQIADVNAHGQSTTDAVFARRSLREADIVRSPALIDTSGDLCSVIQDSNNECTEEALGVILDSTNRQKETMTEERLTGPVKQSCELQGASAHRIQSNNLELLQEKSGLGKNVPNQYNLSNITEKSYPVAFDSFIVDQSVNNTYKGAHTLRTEMGDDILPSVEQDVYTCEENTVVVIDSDEDVDLITDTVLTTGQRLDTANEVSVKTEKGEFLLITSDKQEHENVELKASETFKKEPDDPPILAVIVRPPQTIIFDADDFQPPTHDTCSRNNNNSPVLPDNNSIINFAQSKFNNNNNQKTHDATIFQSCVSREKSNNGLVWFGMDDIPPLLTPDFAFDATSIVYNMKSEEPPLLETGIHTTDHDNLVTERSDSGDLVHYSGNIHSRSSPQMSTAVASPTSECKEDDNSFGKRNVWRVIGELKTLETSPIDGSWENQKGLYFPDVQCPKVKCEETASDDDCLLAAGVQTNDIRAVATAISSSVEEVSSLLEDLRTSISKTSKFTSLQTMSETDSGADSVPFDNISVYTSSASTIPNNVVDPEYVKVVRPGRVKLFDGSQLHNVMQSPCVVYIEPDDDYDPDSLDSSTTLQSNMPFYQVSPSRVLLEDVGQSAGRVCLEQSPTVVVAADNFNSKNVDSPSGLSTDTSNRSAADQLKTKSLEESPQNDDAERSTTIVQETEIVSLSVFSMQANDTLEQQDKNRAIASATLPMNDRSCLNEIAPVDHFPSNGCASSLQQDCKSTKVGNAHPMQHAVICASRQSEVQSTRKACPSPPAVYTEPPQSPEPTPVTVDEFILHDNIVENYRVHKKRRHVKKEKRDYYYSEMVVVRDSEKCLLSSETCKRSMNWSGKLYNARADEELRLSMKKFAEFCSSDKFSFDGMKPLNADYRGGEDRCSLGKEMKPSINSGKLEESPNSPDAKLIEIRKRSRSRFSSRSPSHGSRPLSRNRPDSSYEDTRRKLNKVRSPSKHSRQGSDRSVDGRADRMWKSPSSKEGHINLERGRGWRGKEGDRRRIGYYDDVRISEVGDSCIEYTRRYPRDIDGSSSSRSRSRSRGFPSFGRDYDRGSRDRDDEGYYRNRLRSQRAEFFNDEDSWSFTDNHRGRRSRQDIVRRPDYRGRGGGDYRGRGKLCNSQFYSASMAVDCDDDWQGRLSEKSKNRSPTRLRREFWSEGHPRFKCRHDGCALCDGKKGENRSTAKAETVESHVAGNRTSPSEKRYVGLRRREDGKERKDSARVNSKDKKKKSIAVSNKRDGRKRRRHSSSTSSSSSSDDSDDDDDGKTTTTLSSMRSRTVSSWPGQDSDDERRRVVASSLAVGEKTSPGASSGHTSKGETEIRKLPGRTDSGVEELPSTELVLQDSSRSFNFESGSGENHSRAFESESVSEEKKSDDDGGVMARQHQQLLIARPSVQHGYRPRPVSRPLVQCKRSRSSVTYVKEVLQTSNFSTEVCIESYENVVE